MGWTAKDLIGKKLVQVNGGMYEKISRQQVKKEKIQKLPNLLERAQMQAIPENKIIGEDSSKAEGKVFIKPLSVNSAWKGKRYKSDKYIAYGKALSFLLPNNIVIPDGLLKIHFEFGLSSMGGDFDNPVKPNLDLIATKYQFNDNRIRRGVIDLIAVPKGHEYIKFTIESLK